MTQEDRVSPALLTDLYQLTMAYGYWKNEMLGHEAVFHAFFRLPPFNGGYTIACGLGDVIDYLQHFRFNPMILTISPKSPVPMGNHSLKTSFWIILKRSSLPATSMQSLRAMSCSRTNPCFGSQGLCCKVNCLRRRC